MISHDRECDVFSVHMKLAACMPCDDDLPFFFSSR